MSGVLRNKNASKRKIVEKTPLDIYKGTRAMTSAKKKDLFHAWVYKEKRVRDSRAVVRRMMVACEKNGPGLARESHATLHRKQFWVRRSTLDLLL